MSCVRACEETIALFVRLLQHAIRAVSLTMTALCTEELLMVSTAMSVRPARSIAFLRAAPVSDAAVCTQRHD